MKQISLPRAALLALLQAGICEVRKPVARSPAVEDWAPKCDWFTSIVTDKYGLEQPGPEVYGFFDPQLPWIGWHFPWGGPASKVEIKGAGRTAEILAVEVRPARKKYYWVITLKLF